MSKCPNCQQPVGPADDICENCGAVLSTVSTPTFVAASSSLSFPPLTLPTASSGSRPGHCPNCQHPLTPDEDICEQCGMVVDAVSAASSVPLVASANVTQAGLDQCPQCKGPRVAGVKFCGRCGFSYVGITGPTSGGSAGAAASDPPAIKLKPGNILHNKYRVLKEIGAGGMGAVYLAEDQVLKRQVVIKALLSDDDPDMVEQSVKEREFLAAIKHANIVSIYDFVTIGVQGYIVMEYVHGKTLDQLLEERGRPFEVVEAINYILGILPAFTYLAKLELVYCDFKPQNVMVETLKDGTQVVKLIDLGTVIKYTPHPGAVYGTHGFYAPEAVKNPSPETDLYTICRTLAYLVTQMDLASPIFGMPSSEYYKAFRDYPALYRLLTKGTSSRPSQRFHSAEELSDQLAGVLRQIVGGSLSVPIASRLFVPGILTTTGKLGLRGEAVLDEKDKAIDTLRFGDQALRGGNYVNAENFYKQALKINPRSLDAHLRLAEVYIDQGEYTQALAEVTTVQRMAPGNWKIAWYTGRLLEAQGKAAAAADQYRELMADLPGELPPQQALARVSARLGDDGTAVELYVKVLKADPGNTEAILGVTMSLLNLQRWDEAARVLSSVNEAAAKYIDARLLLCELYLSRMTPLTPQNVESAAQAVHGLEGRTEDPRYYLARADVYQAAWKLARRQQLPAAVQIAGVANNQVRTLGIAAEESYQEYLRRAKQPKDRESVVRRKNRVAPWRWL
ncbi:protein kinase domain-containing protein [Tengunoibacter tsumagoiensis]|uniref:non-specific serine/threonine protein kinase n=1 Tax=Tengunoibacter tsumagoiensis TaxID=2014871 RepID=A0A402A3K5_9CHLR|nr:tetratricopeptide repeat protein [Tengunoibacter tsumagoiensis]GCE13629.1 hypothetical protein KTT_34880 [Tengunoibacter tsumagoiensis]